MRVRRSTHERALQALAELAEEIDLRAGLPDAIGWLATRHGANQGGAARDVIRAADRWGERELEDIGIALEVYGCRKPTPAGLVWAAHTLAAASEAAAEQRGLDPGSIEWGDRRVAAALRWLADVVEEAAASKEAVSEALAEGERAREHLLNKCAPAPDDGRLYR